MTYRENCTGCTERDAEITRLRAKSAEPKTRREWINAGGHEFDIQHGFAWIVMMVASVALVGGFIAHGWGDPHVRRGAYLFPAAVAVFRWVMTRRVTAATGAP